ncbi:hypothetical protein [Pseudonocardia pini]|uniref:hypothetical protein n=1 Tax=Pseudonocardia pini TaxID=2758030 RepID=UPI0015F0EDF4|nr:hypothetical protein [Pseudonocardia pini]
MRVYAERPGRFGIQLLSDVAAVAWAIAWLWLAATTHDLLLTLQAPGRTLTQAGESVQGAFEGAARGAGDVPFVGDQLARAFAPGSDAGRSLASAGQQLIDTVAGVATGAAILVAVLGLLPVLSIWLPIRIRYARAASMAVEARGRGGDQLALRALVHRRIPGDGVDPAAAWRTGDPDAVATLADIELRALGLKELRPAIRFSSR